MAIVNPDMVQIRKDKFVSKSSLLSHLKTYNLYYEEQALHLRHREEEGELIIEGLLNIFWGLHRPIRLQMEDGKEPIKPAPFISSWCSGSDASKAEFKNQNINLIAPTIEVTGPVNQSKYSSRDVTGEKGEEVSSYVQRTRSDVGGKRLIGRSAPGVQRRIRRHRCSFNGHFYNHKTAVFTPAFGSVTNVRINSSMTTSQVLRVLLNKFKIENSPDEFSLFLLHTSGERVQLKRDEHPLLVRILQGPCEQVSKIFLMEPDQVEEVTYDVAQYIKLEMPILQSFISKLQEEENREMEKLKQRYCAMRTMIQKHMQRLANKVVG
ncbi:ras association domain-containing protein 2b [Electrophorus electricus]|uniref:Ras association domain family member 2b n=1 Tax=Electrophorus electricus TaxID=8005 RepID=A0A4W4FVW7_ELEEL|nr:ras association domain-containing protein 2b [Electrophorus electricus]